MGFALIIVHSETIDCVICRYVVCGVLIEFYKWRTVSKQSCHATLTRNGASHTSTVIICRVLLLH